MVAITAANIPPELFDLILSFLVHQADDGDDRISDDSGDHWYGLNLVLVDKRNLSSVTLVCRHWAKLTQRKLFENLFLRNKRDAEELLRLLDNPSSRILQYISVIIFKLTLTQSPWEPWIHVVLPPLFRRFRTYRQPTYQVQISGPLPGQRSCSSVHGSFPYVSPKLGKGISALRLTDLHLKTFEHVVRLVRELPTLKDVVLRRVTWDTAEDDPEAHSVMPAPRAYMSRDVEQTRVDYEAMGCTDDAAAGWLSWLVALDRTDIVERDQAENLYHIAQAFFKNVDRHSGAENPVRTGAYRRKGEIVFWAVHLRTLRYVTPRLRVYLTPPTEGQRRRIRGIVLEFYGPGEAAEIVGHTDWAAMDTRIAALGMSQSLLFACWKREGLFVVRNEIVCAHMTQLRALEKVKCALLLDDGGSNRWTEVSFTADDAFENIGKEAEGLTNWTALL
ncbi:hypothetical protein NM688_g7797 [Phlebia brevispora]|uniref:Uncharacterized protein n=1 Tax=Phlebia brevispora TaxID=194682 RepID=A0ACC1S1A7_9APHY|nr:hypothetical protein NM688_g7797 [Phlebia brevispora]